MTLLGVENNDYKLELYPSSLRALQKGVAISCYKRLPKIVSKAYFGEYPQTPNNNYKLIGVK